MSATVRITSISVWLESLGTIRTLLHRRVATHADELTATKMPKSILTNSRYSVYTNTLLQKMVISTDGQGKEMGGLTISLMQGQPSER